MQDESNTSSAKSKVQPDLAATDATRVALAATSDDQDEVLDLVAEKIKSGRCLLFLGSGVHRAPGLSSRYHYDSKECPPVGKDLARLLAAKSGFRQEFPDPSEREDDLMRVSQYYELKRFRQTLIDEIRKVCRRGKNPLLLSGLWRGLISRS
jgi:hypothetical protein